MLLRKLDFFDNIYPLLLHLEKNFQKIVLTILCFVKFNNPLSNLHSSSNLESVANLLSANLIEKELRHLWKEEVFLVRDPQVLASTAEVGS